MNDRRGPITGGTVGDRMSRDLVTIRGGAPLAECARELAFRRIRHLQVVDEYGALSGVVDDATVFQRGVWLRDEGWVPFELSGPQGVARDIAAPAGLVVGPLEPLVRVLHALRDGLDAALVVDPDHRPVGIFTDHDGAALAAQVLPHDHLARDAGTRPAVTVAHGDLALDAFDAMIAFDVRHAVVVDAEEVPVGVVSWRDLVEHDVSRRPHLTVAAVIRLPEVYTVREDESVALAAARLVEHDIGCLPVVDDEGRLLRIIGRTDVIGLMVDHLTR